MITCNKNYIYEREDGISHARRSVFFIALTFDDYECFCYEILILIKTKNINIFCFQVITNSILIFKSYIYIVFVTFL